MTTSPTKGTRDKAGPTPRRPRRTAAQPVVAAAQPYAPRPSLRAAWSAPTLVRYAVAAVLTPAALAYAAPRWLGAQGTSGTLLAIGVGLSVVASFAVHRTLATQLGRLTAIAALTLVSIATFTTWAALSATCPDGGPGRCTGPELANWAMIGALLPAVYVMIAILPFVAIRIGKGLGWAWRTLAGHWRAAHDPATATTTTSVRAGQQHPTPGRLSRFAGRR